MQDLLNAYRQEAQAGLFEAKALPFAVYHDREIAELETNKVFRCDWNFACAEQALADAGSYYAFDLAGEAVVIIRGQDKQLRAMSNNCRHRGTPLLDEGFGEVGNNISCPYHAWTYDDKGNFKGAPMPGQVTLDKQAHCLPQFRLESWQGLLFINLDSQAQPLSERFSGIEEYIAVYQPERFNSYGGGEVEHWRANWKVVMENALESYHIFKVHKETLEPVTPTKLAYYVAGSAAWTITGGKLVDDVGTLTKWLRGKYPRAYDHYQLIFLPPSLVMILDYDSLSWLHVLPDGPETCVIRSGTIFPESLFKEDQASQAFTRAFFREDKKICERVQKGMHSKIGKGGKLVEMERSVVDFHQYLAAMLFAAETDDFYEDENAALFLGEE
ncbi:aromatic ring-hydroxylating dioxygenase subunit alpha [Thalassomonas viridans]|uniref:Aromatic ring-hydroxylating dioxygenase subunit alpha n=1 Tax=Thalassomonas viridans TaxID=137584 RepID=A0AAE9Z6W5_9GAMM|nr:aromatic ring-hydroxylating dioxygenase subunit alpha [Thalassomonas viridans]WDE07099.1 aromatic ring-hydroxylating dioxygenase subunit alpha [Thalassomonas viridans]